MQMAITLVVRYRFHFVDPVDQRSTIKEIDTTCENRQLGEGKKAWLLISWSARS